METHLHTMHCSTAPQSTVNGPLFPIVENVKNNFFDSKKEGQFFSVLSLFFLEDLLYTNFSLELLKIQMPDYILVRYLSLSCIIINVPNILYITKQLLFKSLSG